MTQVGGESALQDLCLKVCALALGFGGLGGVGDKST